MCLDIYTKIDSAGQFESVVIGMVLGDAWISQVTKRNPNARLFLSHSIKQESYLDFKLNLLNTLTKVNKYPKTLLNKRTGKIYKSVSGQSRSSPYYSYIRRLCYKDGVKIVSRGILDCLDPFGLAIWYMDDGHAKIDRRKKSSGGTIDLSTCGFSYGEHLIIQDYFSDVWGIDTAIHKTGKYFRTHFNHKNSLNFMKLVKPYMHESMCYKVIHSVESSTLQ